MFIYIGKIFLDKDIQLVIFREKHFFHTCSDIKKDSQFTY